MSSVRPCVSDTYMSLRDAVVDKVFDTVEETGMKPAALAKVLSEAETAETAQRILVAIVEAARDRIEAKGYHPCEIAQNLPSVRRAFAKRFMERRELVALERSLSMLEAVGVRARIVFETDDSISPRRRPDLPRATYDRAPRFDIPELPDRGLSVAGAGRPLGGTVPSGTETSLPRPVA